MSPPSGSTHFTMIKDATRFWVGIDSAINGSIAFLSDDELSLDTYTLPLIVGDHGRDSRIDVDSFLKIFTQYRVAGIAMEWFYPHAMNGKKTWFKLGMALGQIEAAVVSRYGNVLLVEPKEWQRTVLSEWGEYEWDGRQELKGCSMRAVNEDLGHDIGTDDNAADATNIARYLKWYSEKHEQDC